MASLLQDNKSRPLRTGAKNMLGAKQMAMFVLVFRGDAGRAVCSSTFLELSVHRVTRLPLFNIKERRSRPPYVSSEDKVRPIPIDLASILKTYSFQAPQ